MAKANKDPPKNKPWNEISVISQTKRFNPYPCSYTALPI